MAKFTVRLTKVYNCLMDCVFTVEAQSQEEAQARVDAAQQVGEGPDGEALDWDYHASLGDDDGDVTVEVTED
jgi:hypothetical protein